MDSVKKELAKELGHEPREVAWNYLVEKRYVSEYKSDGGDISHLVEEYRYICTVIDGSKKETTSRREVPPDKRTMALSEIIALRAAKSPEVEAFRNDVSGGKLLKPKEVEGWIQEALREGGQTKRDLTLEYWMKTKDGLVSDTINIAGGGTLERLKDVVSGLIKNQCPLWEEYDAVQFVLCGVTPPIPTTVAIIKARESLTLSRIELTIDPRMQPRELARFYSDVRRLLWGNKKPKPMSDKHLELALFAARNEGESWEVLRKKWNKKNPEWEYTALSARNNFPRDVRHAYERVTGKQLNRTRKSKS